MRSWKSLIPCFVLLMALMLLSIPTKANAVMEGYYYYSVSGGKATITDVYPSISGNITIPSTLGGYPVTTIGEEAFFDCRSLTGITIPDSVTTIGDGAFFNCTSLTSATIPDSVTTIGDGAFFYCNRLTGIWVDATNPNYCSDSYGVLYNKNMTTLVQAPGAIQNYDIPDSVTTIGDSAFSNCDSLTSVTIPDSVTTIGDSAFTDCDSLTSVTIGDSVTTIGDKVFYACGSLTSVTIGDSVTTIGNRAFEFCRSLTGITIGDSVTTIGDRAFYYCDSLKDVYYTGTEAQWKNISIGSWNGDLTDATIHYNWHEHVFTNYVSNKDATCVADGTKTAKCDRCDVTDTIADPGTALGHGFTNYIPNKDATCGADGTKTAKCDRCGVTDTIADPGTALGHSFTNYISNKDATCGADGTKTAKCDRCDVTDTVVNPGSATGIHSWDEGTYYPPTSKLEGYTKYSCIHCGETKVLLDTQNIQITQQPASVAVDSGETVQFHVETQGEVVSWKWEYRKLHKWFSTSMTGYNTDTLTVPATGARNGYDYRCLITFKDGTVLISDAAELTVKTYMNITYHPNDQVVVLGYKGQFTAAAEGEGLKYQWQYCRPGSTLWIDTAMEGATKQTVYIETTTARDGYMYRCKITDVTGNEMFTEVATMTVLSVKGHPTETFAATGATVQFTVKANVSEGFTYQWQYRRNANASWTNTTLEGYNTATLTVSATKARNGYEYRCVLTGSKNSKIESKGAVLHVGDPLVLEDQSVSCTVSAGKNVVLNVYASNVYTYQWQYTRAGSDIWFDTSMEGADTANLKVQAITSRNGYRYRCVITGLDGTQIISEPITLTVK